MSNLKQPKAPRRGPMGRGPVGAVEKPKNFKQTLGKLFHYMGRYKIAVFFVMLFAVASTVFTIIGPKILGNATTELFNGMMSHLSGGAGINFDIISQILLFLLGLYIASAVFGYIQGLIMTWVTQRTTYRMRKDLAAKINRLPMKYFDKKQHGEVLSLITNDVDTLSTGLNQSATQLITSITSVIGVLIMMFSIDWVITLVAMIILPLSAFFVALVVKISQKYFKRQQDYLGHVNGEVEENFGGINIIQSFNKEESTTNKFEEANDILCASAWKSQFLSGLLHPIMVFIGNLGYVAVAILGSYFAIQGRITVGNIQAFIQYMRNFTQPIAQIAQVSNMIQSMTAAAERIFDFLEQTEEDNDLATENPLKNIDPKDEKAIKETTVALLNKKTTPNLEDIQGNINFNNVHFGYEPEKIVINNFSSKVKKGEKIAIVGPTGAGKTTIVKLLMRFYDLNKGTITVDGHDICEFDRQNLREIFGMVLQDTWLFSGTIMENIRYGKLDATDREVIAAAKAARAHHFIKTLPDSYNMELNEEASNISQGQKQLLTIARTILADPKILILDEATSSVDPRTEEQIQVAMDNLMQGRTCFIIAHRLSTITNADQILVMKDGDIIEQGTHQELLAQKGFYASMYNSQFDTITA
ncbi:MAG: ABC transporter ATP-binding protein [Clostridiales bacterium]